MHFTVPNFIREKLQTDKHGLMPKQSHLFIGKRYDLNALFSDAMSGDLHSIARVASLYFWGHGVRRDPDFALSVLNWIVGLDLSESSSFEYAYARYLIHQNKFDRGVPYLMNLASNGHGMAMTTLSYLYEKGRGLPLNKELHQELLRAGAKTKDPQSRSALMHFYFKRGGLTNTLLGLSVGLSNILAVIKMALSSDYEGRV